MARSIMMHFEESFPCLSIWEIYFIVFYFCVQKKQKKKHTINFDVSSFRANFR